MAWLAALPSRDRWFLTGAVVAGVVLRLAYVLATTGHRLAGDEPFYHDSAVLQTEGHWFWSVAPYGIAHESFWKAPGYQVWTGLWYELIGADPDRLFAVQAVLLAPLVIVLGFVLAQRLFGTVAGLIAAWLCALHPNIWQWEVRLFSESLATPMTVALLLLALTTKPSRRAIIGAGVLLGAMLLIRPTAYLVIPAFVVGWWAVAGARRGLLATAAVVGIAVVIVAPWTLRNLSVDSDHFVPISVQDAAAYGVFNDDAANDDDYPWKWRPTSVRDSGLFNPDQPLSEGELRAELQRRVREYIRDHPTSVLKAFWYNGIRRLWDFDPVSQTLDDTRFEGRTRAVAGVGLGVYWLMLPFAAMGLWLLWTTGRRRIVLALAAVGLTASVTYTADAGTRYRAPLEPAIAALAAGGAAHLARRGRRQHTVQATPAAGL